MKPGEAGILDSLHQFAGQVNAATWKGCKLEDWPCVNDLWQEFMLFDVEDVSGIEPHDP